MTDNTDEFLQHFGVAGMKWGKRKVQYAEGGNTVRQRLSTEANRQIDKNDGRRGVTAAKSAGKTIAAGLIAQVGTIAVTQLINQGARRNQTVRTYQKQLKQGVGAVNKLFQVSNSVAGVADVAAIATAKRPANG